MADQQSVPDRPGVWSAYRIPLGQRFDGARLIVRSFKAAPT
jgi:hypothetical protein